MVPTAEPVTFSNPVIAGGRGDDHGDPFIIRYLDEYFLYHSGETSGRKGISVHRSSDLVDWEFAGFALEPAEEGWAWSDLWAPEVVYERGTFYMYVTGTVRFSRTRRGRWQVGESDDSGRRLGVARSQSPLGPFVLDEEPLVDAWSLDGHPFRDEDGSIWLFYNVRNEHTGFLDGSPGTGIVCDRLLDPGTLAGRPRPVVAPSSRWEGNREGDFYWNEAPYVLKRRDTYHLMYSGGYFADDTYAIGLARARKASGPWEKHEANPLFRGTRHLRGPGHHSFIFGPDAATRYAVYHAYVGDEPGRKVCLDRMYWLGDRPNLAGPTHEPLTRPPGPVFDEEVPHFVAETWARGAWVEVRGHRFALERPDVWHQVEVEQVDDRFSVRIGGVLRSSRPAGTEHRGPAFAAEGGLGPTTVTTCGIDDELRELPAHSSYTWRWGGSAPIEVTFAARGDVTIHVDGTSYVSSGVRDDFRLVQLFALHGPETLTVEAGPEGATVADLVGYARSS